LFALTVSFSAQYKRLILTLIGFISRFTVNIFSFLITYDQLSNMQNTLAEALNSAVRVFEKYSVKQDVS
jgi:uncharacterized membrane protein YgaE (UPF0421/DUF939 family)